MQAGSWSSPHVRPKRLGCGPLTNVLDGKEVKLGCVEPPVRPFVV